MKLIRILFLFFICFFTFSKVSFAVQEKDSIAYYQNIARNPKSSESLTKAYSFFNEKKGYALVKKDTTLIIFHLINLAMIEKEGGLYVESENTYIKALDLIDKLEETPYLKKLRKSLTTNLAITYREQSNVEKSLDLYNNAMLNAQNAEDSIGIFNNRSNVFKDQGNYLKSKEELLKAQSLISQAKDTLLIALVLNNLGFAYSKLNSDKALNYLEDGLRLREKFGYSKGMYSSYYSLAIHYKDRNNKAIANEYAQKALKMSQLINSTSYRQNALGLIVDLNGNDYVREYKEMTDSITKARQVNTNKFAAYKYDLSKKNEELYKSKLKEQELQRRTLVAQGIIVLVLLIATFLYFVLKSRHKKRRHIEIYNTETRISKKVHDEVANDVYHVMTKLQQDSNIHEDVLDDLEHIYTKTRDISKENIAINFDEKFEELLSDLLFSFKQDNIAVITKGLSKIQWKSLSEIKRTMLYRVLQELMVNMKKHSKASIVVVTFSEVKDKKTIVYKDNGIGCLLKMHGGLSNAENRIHSINGTINFESEINNGFKAIITI
ncbi:tetratricopeptide repeat protein [Pontimicrobium sp. SW4]|uniref:Tetratricopeptide repeat protein n=1 Tax=Pontimicrobium sp. SW4 TaxID=3153519 RepID=A0AAU7BW18_9FLAO